MNNIFNFKRDHKHVITPQYNNATDYYMQVQLTHAIVKIY